MKLKRNITACALLALAVNSYAGFNGPTHHSRANCLNNESISWDKTDSHMYAVVSFHTPDYLRGRLKAHRLDTHWGFTWRQAAVCWGEGKGIPVSNYYLVNGYHWELIDGKEELQKNTLTDFCSLEDGWFK